MKSHELCGPGATVGGLTSSAAHHHRLTVTLYRPEPPRQSPLYCLQQVRSCQANLLAQVITVRSRGFPAPTAVTLRDQASDGKDASAVQQLGALTREHLQ